MVKRITIHGFYGAKNVGDEAILSAMLSALSREIPDADFTVLSIDPEYTFKNHGVKSVYRGYRKAITEKLKLFIDTDLYISGGGGLLQDTYPTGIISGPLPHYLYFALLAKLFGKKVMFYGQGMGPINTYYGKFLTKWIGNQVDLITVRDEESKDLLLKLGVNKPKSIVTADPVLAAELPQKKTLEQIKRLYNIDEKDNWVGISVRPWFKLEDYKTKIAKVCDYIIEELNARILFIPMEHEHDYRVSKEISEQMCYPDKAKIMNPEHSVEDYQAAVGLMNLVVGMRLHSLIFATTLNVPMVGIVYDPKVKSLLKRINMSQYAVDVEDFTEEELKNNIKQVWLTRQQIKKEIEPKVLELKRLALENAKLAAGILKK